MSDVTISNSNVSWTIPQGMSSEELDQVKNLIQGTGFDVTFSTAENGGTSVNMATGAPELEESSIKMSLSDMMLLLVKLNSESSSEQLTATKENIEVTKQQKADMHAERLDKMQEALDSMKDAEKSGIFGKVFGWVATAALIIGGACMMATGVGAAAGAMMIAAGTVMLTSQISAETGNWMNEALAAPFMAMGMSEEDAMLAAQITVLVVVAALTVGAGFAASSGVAATQMAATAAKVGQMAQFSGGLASVGQGVSNGISASQTYDATMAQADAAELQTFIGEMMLLLQDNQDRLEEILAAYQQGISIAMQSLNSMHEVNTGISQSI